MVAFYNALGGLMMVPESRVEEYKALGYREMAPATPEPVQEAEAEKERQAAMQQGQQNGGGTDGKQVKPDAD